MLSPARVAALLLVGFGFVGGGATVRAHHAFSAEFDARKPVKFTATVTKVDWINPHSWFHIQVQEPAAQKGQMWMIEAGNPHSLFRRGFPKDIIKPGMTIIVVGYGAKDGSRRANGRDLTLPDGRTLFVGSSGTGAPIDGKDPSEKSRDPR